MSNDNSPDVSVVMSVYNGADRLEVTLVSVLSQEDCDLEFIVVDDGSTDQTASILDAWALREPRLRVIHQENTGLTRALIRGCGDAKGDFIARQDCGDVSLPGRLAIQAAMLMRIPDSVAISCDTDFIGPGGEFLYRTKIDAGLLNSSLTQGGVALRGPSHHGSVMMRRAVYDLVGGYREAFYFAQDLDLWTRLADHGKFDVVDQVLYRARLDAGSISGVQRLEQERLAGLIAQVCLARRNNESEAVFLQAAASIRASPKANLRKRVAHGNYFIGSCLRRSDPARAIRYFCDSVRADTTHWRSWLRIAECSLRRFW